MLKVLKATFISSIVATSLLASSETIVKVNSSKITKEDIKKIYNIDYDKLNKEQKEQAVDMIVEKELIYQDAKKKNFEKDSSFKAKLDELKKALYVEFWKADIAKKIKISDNEAKKVYDAQKDKFKVEDTALARHILVKTEKEAKDIIKEINSAKDKLSKFKELAKAKSIGPSKRVEGNLGWFPKSKMDKDFSNATFALKKNNYTKKPVKTQFGYHIIYLENKKPAHNLEFKEVKNLIKQKLSVEKLKVELKKQFEAIKAKAKIEIK
jgi:parvulin-like peptidyl-prolyl isomerase